MDLVCNTRGSTVGQSLSEISKNADEVWLAVAFFSGPTLLNEWLKRNCRLRVLVALAYPTDPRVLQKLRHLPPQQAEIKFYDPGFHSKLYVFRKGGFPFGALVGSSNFTNHGLARNIETNLSLKSKPELNALEIHFKDMWKRGKDLSEDDIKRYEPAFYRLRKLNGSIQREQQQLQRDLRRAEAKEARTYKRFTQCLREVAARVSSISKKEWPHVPLYLAVDHFMYWLVNKWNGAERKQIVSSPKAAESILPVLFKRYAKWDKNHQDFTSRMPATSDKLRSLVGKSAINSLTKDGAKDVYESLHSGKSRRRFSGAQSFVADNSSPKIRRSLNHLLWSQDDLPKRISDLISVDRYRLKHFGPSMVQEIVDWVSPDEWPIRNRKADKALERLGYNLS